MWISPEQHKAVGALLAELRRQRNLTQKQVAERLGKPQSFVSSYEAGQRRVDVLELIRIADALKIDALAAFSEVLRAGRG